jgi:hypothetical protein
LLALHKSILDYERTAYEKAVGPVTPAAFLQQLIAGADFRWIAPLSTAIANIDELLDDEKATADDRIAGAQAVTALFDSEAPGNPFRQRYLTLLQESPSILHEHGRIVQALRSVE